MLYKRRARAAEQEAGPLSPLSQRRQDEFDQIRILLLQNELLLEEKDETKKEDRKKEETKKEEKVGDEEEEKKKEEEVFADAEHDGEENATKNDEEGQTMTGSILLL